MDVGSLILQHDDWRMHIVMPDESIWSVPVMAIAVNRASYYAREFGDSVERSLAEDTLPLFDEDSSEIVDWASNNMDWSDVSAYAQLESLPPDPDYQEGWTGGDKTVSGSRKS